MIKDKKIGAVSMVIKYYVTFGFVADLHQIKYEWIQTDGKTITYTNITAAQAHDIIEDDGLVPAKKNKYGVIYDSVDGQGKKLFNKARRHRDDY